VLAGFGNDEIWGNNGANVLAGGFGDDRLLGLNGDDTLIGGDGADTLAGNGGADRFVVDTQGDKVADFSHSDGDMLDFSQVDANIYTDTIDAFSFIGRSAFTGAGGELRIVEGPGKTVIVEGDLTGSGFADFSLTVLGVQTLTAADFIL
jgi:Ca2+-binding RTX toxin-like protein